MSDDSPDAGFELGAGDDHWELLSRQGGDGLWGDLLDPAETRLRETLETIEALVAEVDSETAVRRALVRAAAAATELLEREGAQLESELVTKALRLLLGLAEELGDEELVARLRSLSGEQAPETGALGV